MERIEPTFPTISRRITIQEDELNSLEEISAIEQYLDEELLRSEAERQNLDTCDISINNIVVYLEESPEESDF